MTAKYRDNLPFNERLFMADGGLETTLIFHQGIDLPLFAAIVLLQDEGGRSLLKEYFRPFAETARRYEIGLVLDSVTWRGSPDWGRKLGFSAEKLRDLNRASIDLLEEIRAEWEVPASPMLINASLGPRGDGYNPGVMMSEKEAQQYHAFQMGIFEKTAADLVSGATLNYAEEAIGMTRAASLAGLPIVISFTVETDGCLPTGQSLGEAIGQVDNETSGAPLYYMINCAHTSHFAGVLQTSGAWISRIGGIRANASRLSHAELDQAEELDEGNPQELAADYRALATILPNLRVVGGCCGTDHRHLNAIVESLVSLPRG